MAFPTIPTVAAGRVLYTLNTAGGATKTFPNLSSLTKAAGDLLVAIAVEYDGNSTNAEFSAWGASFTEFVDQATTATMAIGAAYKWSDGSETGTFTVTTADTSTNDSVMILIAVPGAHPTIPPEGGTIANGTSAAADPGSLNPSGWGTEDTLWIAIGGSGEVATTGSFTGITAAPANYTDYTDSGITADVVGGVEAALGFRQLNAASEDPGTFTVDLSNARNSALLLAIPPRIIVNGTADVAGAGAFASVSTVVANAVVGLAGAGAFAADATIIADVNGIADLAGAGAIAASGSVTVHPAAALAGAGAPAAVASVVVHATVDEAGAGVFAAAATTTANAVIDLAGAGSWGSQSSVVAHGSTILAGVGAFAADATIIGNSVFGVADLAGAGAFAASATILGAVNGIANLAGVGSFTSVSTIPGADSAITVTVRARSRVSVESTTRVHVRSRTRVT